MLLLEPLIHYGCRRCDGLFSTQELHSQHVVICNGDRQKSDCPLFACPRDIFLLLNTKANIRDTPDSGDSNHTNTEESWKEDCSTSRKLQIPLALQKCLSGPLKKVRVIGILKKPSPRLYSASNQQLLRNDVDVALDRVSTAGNEQNRGDLVQTHLRSGNLLKPEEVTGAQAEYQETEICSANIKDSDAEDVKLGQAPNDIHDDTVEDPNWEQCKKEDHTVFRCKLCSHESYSVGYMRRHVRVHNNGETMQCDQCDFTTIWRHHLRVHLRKHEQPKFLCEQCPQRFKNRSSLTRHCAKKHKGKTNFSCKYSKDCEFVAVNSASLRDHIRKHTGELLFCDYDQCRFMTKFEKALALHKAKHQGKTRYICEVCGYRTIEAGSFRRHAFTHSGKKLFKCPDCSYKATSRYVVVKHIYGKHINHKRYACNRCDFKTAYYSGLSMHLMAHEGVKPYKCSLCSYRSNLSNKVKRHCSQKHSQTEAKAIKVENCLKFDVKDYLNPEVSKVDVKVIRLTEDGEAQDEGEEEEGETETTSDVLDPDITEDDGLLCESQIPALPSGSGEGLEDISIMDSAFSLCSDPTFPLDSVSQNFSPEHSNSVFLTRPSRPDTSGADVELSKDFDVQKTKVPYFDSPELSLQMSAGPNQNISDLTPVELANLGWKSNSLECLAQIKNSISTRKSSENVSPVVSFSSHLEESTIGRVDTPSPDIRPQLPLLSTSTPFFQMVNFPVLTVSPLHTQNTNQATACPKPLKSLLSPEVLKTISERNPQLQNKSDNSSLADISVTLDNPCLNVQQCGKTVVLTVPRVLALTETKQLPDKLNR